MQINGLREFAANFMPSFQSAGERDQSPAAGFLRDTDAVDVSEVGKSLSYALSKIEKTSSLPGPEGVERTSLTDSVRAAPSDPITDLMDKSFARMEEILTEMNGLAVTAAEDESLNDLDRMSMQIRMEDLRTELYNTSRSINQKLAEMAGYDGARDEIVVVKRDTGVLERALRRLDNGEPWDVAEGLGEYRKTTEVKVRNVITGEERTIEPDDGGMITLDLSEDEEIADSEYEITRVGAYVLKESERYFMPRDEYGNPLDEDGDGKADFIMIPTVREKLEATDTVILMDAESAKKGVKRLEYEMEKFQAMRDEFEAFKADPQRNRALSPTELSSLNAEYEERQKTLLAMQKAEKESWATKLFLTEIGIMKTDQAGNNPKLVYTVGPKGAMFEKLDRFFRSTAGSFSKTFIDESLLYTGGVVNINVVEKDKAA